MASPSIMRSTYTHAQRAGIPNTRVTTPHDHELRFSYCSECAKSRAIHDVERSCSCASFLTALASGFDK
jgi:hypothetical protein